MKIIKRYISAAAMLFIIIIISLGVLSCFASLEDIRALPVRIMDTDKTYKFAPENTVGIFSMSIDPLLRDEKTGAVLFSAVQEYSKSSEKLEPFQGIKMIHNMTIYLQDTEKPDISNITFIIKLTMDLDAVKKSHRGDMEKLSYRTHTLYRYETALFGKNPVYFCIPDESTIIAGSKNNVSHILDVMDGITEPALLNTQLPKALPTDEKTLFWSAFIIQEKDTVQYLQTKQSKDPKPKENLPSSSISGGRIIADIGETTIDVRMDIIIDDQQEKETLYTKVDQAFNKTMGNLGPDASEIISGYKMQDKPWGLLFGITFDKISIIDKIEKNITKEKKKMTFDPDTILKGIL